MGQILHRKRPVEVNQSQRAQCDQQHSVILLDGMIPLSFRVLVENVFQRDGGASGLAGVMVLRYRVEIPLGSVVAGRPWRTVVDGRLLFE